MYRNFVFSTKAQAAHAALEHAGFTYKEIWCPDGVETRPQENDPVHMDTAQDEQNTVTQEDMGS